MMKKTTLLKPILLGLIVSLSLTGRTPAQTITWTAQGVPILFDKNPDPNTYLPKMASDVWANLFIVSYDNTTALGPLQYGSALINDPYGSGLDALVYGAEYAVGSNPSVAASIFSCNPNATEALSIGAVVEVHQGGQDNGAALWSHLAGYNPFLSYTNGTLSFGDGLEYDVGYDPSVAINAIGNCTSNAGSATVVEVHQSGPGYSDLMYHVGMLTENAEGALNLVWGPSYKFDTGHRASVTFCGSTPVEVHEGSNGTLWYSYGEVSGNTINWSASEQYDVGYYPSIVCQEPESPYLVEVHQGSLPAVGDSTDLWYHLAVSPASMGASNFYDTGCNPSVAITPGGDVTPEFLVEVHSETCGQPSPVLNDFGSLPAHPPN
jgi:hypothetical protein